MHCDMRFSVVSINALPCILNVVDIAVSVYIKLRESKKLAIAITLP